MNNMFKTFPQIAHLDDIFDIVGKTIDNVSYSADWHHIIIEFTDESVLTIVPTSGFERASLV